jgi:acylphosphatase
MAIRFRTQDTKSSWARKLNTLFAAAGLREFREVPQTLGQWQQMLNDSVVAMGVLGYTPAKPIYFRLRDTRQLWARKLNVMADVLAAGAKTLAISIVATDDAITDAEAASLTISGTSANLPNGSVVTITFTDEDDVVTSLGTTTVTANAWSKAANDVTALVVGDYVVKASSPGAATASRPVTRTA